MTLTVRSEASTRIESLFVVHEHRLGQFLVQIVRDRALAEDLLQETFAAALAAQDQVLEIEDPSAWLFGIARHRALRALRRTQRMRRALERLAASQPLAPRRVDAQMDGIMDVLDRALSPDDRSLIVLRYVHGFDASQLAELTGRSHAAIRKRLERACARLAKEIER